MSKTRILFISWQAGMGHITRDLAIVEALRLQEPEIEVQWVAHPLACKVLRIANESIMEESSRSADYNQLLAQVASGFRFNLMEYMRASQLAWESNVRLFKTIIETHEFSLVIGDEIYEIADAMARDILKPECPMLMIEDFIGMQAMSSDRIEKIAAERSNRLFVQQASMLRDRLTRLYVGELEDVPIDVFGSPPIAKRNFANLYYKILGYIIRFDPKDYQDKAKVRAKLGYSSKPLVICATGGTSTGKGLIELCGKAYSILKEKNTNVEMISVCGELYGQALPELPVGIRKTSYIDKLFEHYAACDMAVVVGGGTTTIELTALRRPFAFFPLHSQFDQEIYISERLARHGAGIRMNYNDTTPELLAKTIWENIGREPAWKSIPIDGAKKAACVIVEMLGK